ncbi:hypothetical protein BH11GEM2_BH11GEM2_23970 [soil metagenome]
MGAGATDIAGPGRERVHAHRTRLVAVAFWRIPYKLLRVTLQPDLAPVTPASPQVAALLSANGARCPIRPFC